MPPQDVASQLAAVIDELSRHHSTPRFAPHLTLAGGIRSTDIAAGKLRQLAREIGTVEIRPLRLVTREEFFRCIVIEVELGDELIRARRSAERLFDLTPEEFWPHISLVYGELDEETRRATVAKLALPLDPFRAAALESAEIAGSPEKWRVRDRIAL